MTVNDTLVAADGDALARLSAHLVRAWICDAVAARGVARLAISGGSTPRAMMRVLAGLPLPWSATEWFWVDERFVPHDNPRSNYGAAKADLFDHLAASTRGVHPMAGEGSLDEGADAYQALLARSFGLPLPSDATSAVPSFDILLLGIGDDGHTASLFPGEDSVERQDRWVLAVPAAGEREARITLSRPVLTAARRVAVIAQGAGKRKALHEAHAAGPLRDIPSRLTREIQSELLWLLDAAAAG